MKARPLETPRPFPADLHPLVARFAGDAARASYTTGPATREALAQAGALGATTGSVVHLPGAPAAVTPDVLAHELAHARQPVGRPRFLLRVRSGAMDADERAAHAVGQHAAAPVIQRSINPLTSLGRGAVPSPGSVTAGMVDHLPVGGASGNAVSEARSAEEGLTNGMSGAVEHGRTLANADPTARGLLAALAAADPGGAAATAAGGVGRDVAGELDEMAGAAQHEAGAALTGATAAAGHAAGRAAAAASHHLPDHDIQRIVEAVEQRLLRQLERRGGRYAGVF